MRFFSTPDAPCAAICSSCALNSPPEAWEGWRELDPAIQDCPEPTRCERCGATLDPG